VNLTDVSHPGKHRSRKIIESVFAFGEVLEVVDKLSLEEKEALIEVVRRRVIERRRTEAILLETVGTHEEVY